MSRLSHKPESGPELRAIAALEPDKRASTAVFFWMA